MTLTVRGELDHEEEDNEEREEARLDEEYVRVLTSFVHKKREIYVSLRLLPTSPSCSMRHAVSNSDQIFFAVHGNHKM